MILREIGLLLVITGVVVDGQRIRRPPPRVAADIALVDEITSQSQSWKIPSLPNILRLNVTLMDSQKPIPLVLTRNKMMDRQKNMFVIRRGSDGKPALVRVNIDYESNIGYYQDADIGASMTVTCAGLEEGLCDPILQGSIGEYDIEPLKLQDMASISRRRRSAKGKKGKGKKPSKTKTGHEKKMNKQKRKTGTPSIKSNQMKKKIHKMHKAEVADKRHDHKRRKQQKKNEKRLKKLYNVFIKKQRKRNKKDSTKRDVKDKNDRKQKKLKDFPTDSNALHGATMLQVVPEVNADWTQVAVLGRNLVNTKQTSAATTIDAKEIDNKATILNVEILVVIDYGIYLRFFESQNATTNDAKVDQAYEEIRKYFSHVVNGIDMRYRNLGTAEYGIRVTLSSFLILDNPHYPNWDSHKSSTVVTDDAGYERSTLTVDPAIRKLSDWRRDMINIEPSKLPEHDHLMLFTDHDLTSDGDAATSGYAYVGELCSPFSVSIVEDHGLYGGIFTAAHELGHSLGANHDGEGNVCTSEDSFIMAEVSGSTSSETLYNPYIFSNCSKKAFKLYIDSLNNPLGTVDNCLLDEALIYDEDEFNMAIDVPPGQLVTPNQQCQERLGPDSYYGWGGSLGEYSDICTQLSCKNPETEFKYKIYTALMGTTCGDGKWCFEGRCVQDVRAPSANPLCVHGDSSVKFEANETCADVIPTSRALCYQNYYSDLCCESCEKEKSSDENCLYGDKSTQCPGVYPSPELCYNIDNRALCCESCADLHTGIQGCEFGDKQANCEEQYCNLPGNEAYTDSCCYTCGTFDNTTSFPITTKAVTPSTDAETTYTATQEATATQQIGSVTTGSASTEAVTAKAQIIETVTTGSASAETVTPVSQTTKKTATMSATTDTPTTDAVRTEATRTENSGKAETGITNTTKAETASTEASTIHAAKTMTAVTEQTTAVKETTDFSTTEVATTEATTEQPTDTQTTEVPSTTAHNRELTTETQTTESLTTKSATTETQVNDKQTTETQIANQHTTKSPDLKLDTNKDNSLLCLKDRARFGILSCSMISALIPRLCYMDILKERCCEKCADCEDMATCRAPTAQECYNHDVQTECCATCKNYETQKEGCIYGDKNSYCRRFTRYYSQYVCSKHSEICCESCDKTHSGLGRRRISNRVAQHIDRILYSPLNKRDPELKETVDVTVTLSTTEIATTTATTVLPSHRQLPKVKRPNRPKKNWMAWRRRLTKHKQKSKNKKNLKLSRRHKHRRGGR